ncbi:PREDICTED: uncharacterized protein LOC105462179, partial [Wasmannia auropunctata]|uniref:uncharacterized protein LOC105462179 n=1 Tax=Wasmannia auropunctata TaxID=64793 RepID=UPI0005EE43F2
MALMQFLSNTFVICFLGFIIVTVLGSPGTDILMVKIIPYYMVVNLEAFILCFSGEYLSSKVRKRKEKNWFHLHISLMVDNRFWDR